jgi:hypothetical protein
VNASSKIVNPSSTVNYLFIANPPTMFNKGMSLNTDGVRVLAYLF